MMRFDCGKNPLENIVGKGGNASNQHFFLFPTMLYKLSETNSVFSATFKFQFIVLEILLILGSRAKYPKYPYFRHPLQFVK